MNNALPRTRGLNGFELKIIAIVAMLIDHIGCLLFPQYLFLRIIGRLTMPIMCFFIAEGYRYTRNFQRYIGRMAVFALLTQPIYMLTFGYNLSAYYRFGSNVMFTFVFGLLALWCVEHIRFKNPTPIKTVFSWVVRACAVLGIMLLADLARTDYGHLGVGMIVALGLGKGNKKRMLLFLVLFILALNIFIPLANYLMSFWSLYGLEGKSLSTILHTLQLNSSTLWYNLQPISRFIQGFSLLSIPLLLLYNGQRGKDARYLFYIFYPAHLLLLYLAQRLF